MSLRLRFAIVFAVSIAVLLLISSLTIYYLYFDHRQNEYSTRLRNELKLTLDEFKDKELKGAQIDNSITFECGDNTLIDKEVYVIDDDYNILYAYQNATHYIPRQDLYDEIKSKKDVYYTINEREFVAEYFPPSKKYVIVSAVDNDGFLKLSKLKYYLFLVSISSLIVSLLSSFFIGSAALRPLKTLNEQIKKTTEQNLSQQIIVTKGKDEVSTIAQNYNALMLRLDKAFDIQKNFVHHASHELRTPLATMYATTEVALQKNLSSDEYKEILSSFQQELNHLIELSNSLLLLFQFEKLQYKPNLLPVRVDEVVYEAMSQSHKNFPSINIDFGFGNIPEEDALVINGNEVLLKSAFGNLIKNAYLYSTNQSVKIMLTTNNNKVQVKFENAGKHLTQSVIDNIKQPFSSGENIGIRGIGLGLSIVERIVNLHKGNFSYEAKDKDVNVFCIEL